VSTSNGNLVPSHPGNAPALKHGLHARPEFLAPEIAERVTELAELPWATNADRVALEEVGRLLVLIEHLDADLAKRGTTRTKTLIDQRVRLSRANRATIGNVISVLPDGTLVDVFESSKGSAKQSSPNQYTDGTLYVAWCDSRFSGGARDDIALSKSTDGGLTWSEPIKVNQTPVPVAAFDPAIDVSPDGTGATAGAGSPQPVRTPRLAWIVYSHDGSGTWGGEQRLTPVSFDMNAAPSNTANPSDIFVTQATP
jgi:hypothetical protein